MEDQLVQLLVTKAGLSEEQAQKAIDTIAGYVKDNPEELARFMPEGELDDITHSIGKLFKR